MNVDYYSSPSGVPVLLPKSIPLKYFSRTLSPPPPEVVENVLL